MGKSFLRLYVLLAITITVFIIGLKTLPTIILDDLLAQHRTNVANGTFYLIRQELYSVPEDQWLNKISELQPHFGYYLALDNLDDLKLSDKQLGRIHSGITASTSDDIDSKEVLHSLMPNTNKVISVSFDQSDLEHSERTARGAFYIGFKSLKKFKPKDWQQALDEMSKEFRYPLTLIPLNKLNLKKEYVNIIRNGGTYGENPRNNGETYYKRIPDSDFVVKAGPIHVNTLIVDLFYYSMAFLAIMIALALYIWMRPISNDLIQLSNAALSFGNGQFDTRINVGKNSAIVRVTDTFNGMADRIKKLIDSHKELTNAVSHELRTPISRLRFAIEMLKESNDTATTQKYINSMNTDIDELDSLVTELLTYAQFDRETPELNLESVNFGAWINNFTEHHQIEINNINLQLEKDLLLDNTNIVIDSKLVHRAISNLLTNAIRYAVNNIRISAKYNETSFTISVEDDGSGIAVEDREKILEPFKRLDLSRDRRSGGCGLGLSIVKQIAAWHDGKITISESDLGGSKFNFECRQNNSISASTTDP
ncbi:Sensory histidine kinase in two-component regulatory system with RstA [hydrothermal vent metagenome]|uniref:histidine kinase n=1 Tax=hydrothermal vent metagenome TaxID=652676 RepID=A0A3B1A3B7_9ZZZZ